MAAKEFMKMSLKTVLAAIGLSLIFMVGVFVSGMGQSASAISSGAPTAADAEQGITALLLLFLASLIQASAFTYLVLESRWKGWRLTGALALVVLNMWVQAAIESAPYLRGRVPTNFSSQSLVMGLVNATLFAPFAVWALGGFRKDKTVDTRRRAPWTAGQSVKTLAATTVAFVALYYLCGYYIAWQNPALRQFYSGSTEIKGFWAQFASIWSSMPWMYAFQAGRGLIFVAMTLPAVLMLRDGVRRVAFGTAVMYATWDGSMGLMVPNPIMPPSIAYTHLVELAVWGILFGAFVGWSASQGRPATVRKLEPSQAV